MAMVCRNSVVCICLPFLKYGWLSPQFNGQKFVGNSERTLMFVFGPFLRYEVELMDCNPTNVIAKALRSCSAGDLYKKGLLSFNFY